MNRTVFWSALVGAVSALLVGGTVAVATNINFVLGKANTPDALTSVTAQNKDTHGGLNGPMIQLTNSSTASSATPLGLTAGAKRPPFTTNSSVRVRNLDADLLDGIDSMGFLRGSGHMVTGRVQIPFDPGDAVTIFDQSSATPAFSIDYYCKDPTFHEASTILLYNRSSTAVMDAVWNDGASGSQSGIPNGTAAGGPPPTAAWNGAVVELHAFWYDGHTATIWLFTWAKTDQPDPRDDGCYVDMLALIQ